MRSEAEIRAYLEGVKASKRIAEESLLRPDTIPSLEELIKSATIVTACYTKLEALNWVLQETE